MNKILFGQSYYLRFDPKLWEAMQPYPPLGTLYAASYLRERGYEVALFDAMLAASEDEWEETLKIEGPAFAVIFEDNFNYLSKMCLLRMRHAALHMIEMAKAHGCIVIICGSDASDHPNLYLEGGADFVLLGEGEYTLGELLDRISGKTEKPLSEIYGLAFSRDRIPTKALNRADFYQIKRVESNSSVIQTPRRPDIKELDVLPFPAWDLVDIPRYRKIWMDNHGYYSMNMVTTRGCPYHCNWCAKPIWGQRYNVRSPENVVEELKWLKVHYHPNHIWFVDDIMGLKPGWLPKFAELIEENEAKIPFKCLSRVDLLLREGEIEALKTAGAQIIWVGAESGSQKILNAMEKGTKVEQIYEASRLLREADVEIGFFLQFGYPGETKSDIKKTFQMVRDCMPDDIGMSVSYPLPGTRFYEQVKDQLGIQQNWVDSSDLAMMYEGPYATAFYRQLHVVLHKEYRARKYWRRILQTLLRPAQIRKQTFRQAVAMIYHTLTLLWERYRLKKLEWAPHKGIDTLPVGMSLEDASRPTPQSLETMYKADDDVVREAR